MPVEIREIVVRVTVDAEAQKPARGSQQSGQRRHDTVQEAVDQVLEVLRERQEP